MAKGKQTEAAEARPGHNVADGALVEQMFRSYFRIEDDKNSLRQGHRSKIGGLTEQQNEVLVRVKDGGHSVRAFKEMLAKEKDRRRVENRVEKLDDDDRDALDAMIKSLAHVKDLPIFAAALKAAGASGDEFEEDVRGTDQREREALRKERNANLDAAASNGAERLADLKPLH